MCGRSQRGKIGSHGGKMLFCHAFACKSVNTQTAFRHAGLLQCRAFPKRKDAFRLRPKAEGRIIWDLYL